MWRGGPLPAVEVTHSRIGTGEAIITKDGREIEQQLLVRQTVPRDVMSDSNLPTAVMLMPFSDDPGRPDGAHAAIAAGIQGRLVEVCSPGVDYWGDDEERAASRLTPQQADYLRRGSFRGVGEAIAKVVNKVAPGKNLLYGSSMAAGSVAALATALTKRDREIAGVVFWRLPTSKNDDWALWRLLLYEKAALAYYIALLDRKSCILRRALDPGCGECLRMRHRMPHMHKLWQGVAFLPIYPVTSSAH